MKELDEESKQFIEFALKRLEDFTFRKVLVIKAIYKFTKYINTVDLEKKVKAKLVKGGLEHGEPIYSQNEIKKELEDEFLDLLGWQLVSLWQKNRKK